MDRAGKKNGGGGASQKLFWLWLHGRAAPFPSGREKIGRYFSALSSPPFPHHYEEGKKHKNWRGTPLPTDKKIEWDGEGKGETNRPFKKRRKRQSLCQHPFLVFVSLLLLYSQTKTGICQSVNVDKTKTRFFCANNSGQKGFWGNICRTCSNRTICHIKNREERQRGTKDKFLFWIFGAENCVSIAGFS